jgi:hypothetical protein
MRPHFTCLLCLVAKPPPLSPRKAQALCCRHRALHHPGTSLCSWVTGAAQAVPVASAVETAVCPPSVMAEMCGRLLPNSMPSHTHHTYTQKKFQAVHHRHNTIKGVKRAPWFRGQNEQCASVRITPYLMQETIGTQSVVLNVNLSRHLCIKRFVHAWNSKWFIV